MNTNKYTEKAQEALYGAQQYAEARSHNQVDVEHLLLQLLDQEDGVVPRLLLTELEQELEKLPKIYGSTQLSMSQRLRKVVQQAYEEANRLTDEYVSTEHFLLAILDDREGAASMVLSTAGITRDRALQGLQEVRGGQRVTDPNPESKYQSLERYGRDLTKLAASGKLDPVIGRDDEIRRV